MSKFNSCLRNGHVSFGDDFDTVAEVMHLHGLKATKLPYRTSAGIPDKEHTIAWLPSEDGGRDKTGGQWHNVPEYGPNTDSRGWNEVVTISEYNDDAGLTAKRVAEELAEPKTRYVYMREERAGVQWYKFYGTFKIDAGATRARAASDRPCVVYRRTSQTAECRKVEVEGAAFTDADFTDLRGREVKANFLDEVDFAAECDEAVRGRVRVWPDTEFLVTDVSSSLDHVTCTTKDERLLDAVTVHIPDERRTKFAGNVSFAIPRNDFELGYVGVLPCARCAAACPAVGIQVQQAA